MDPMAYEGETASPDAFSDDSSCSTPSGGSNQLDNRLQVVIWLKEHYRVGEAGSMRKSFVYQHYLDACRESGMEGAPISHTFFGKLVRRAFPGIKCNRKGPRGDAHQCYTHLERLPMAQRLGAWQVEQITEELSKCSSSGSPTSSRLSPLRPKTSPRPRDTHHRHHQDHGDEVPSTPTSDDHAHQQQQPCRHQHPNHEHAHQGRQCFSSCCSPLSSPPIAFSSASTSSSFSSSPRTSCCPEEGEFHHEDAPSCCSGHHHPSHHSHYHHPSSSSSSSSGDESYESYHPDEQLSLLQQQQQQHYLPDLAYAAPAFLSYPAFYGHPTTYSSYSPSAEYHAQQQQQLQLHHHQYPQSASPTFDLSTTGEEVEEEFGVGNVNALASPRQGNGVALTFADYLTACQTARQQQQQHPLHTSATIAEGQFETDRGEDAAASTWSTDGCSRTEPLAALSWASTAWSDAIY